MKREFLFSLAGFLGGFVVAAAIFWQSAGAPSSNEKPEPAGAATGVRPGGGNSPAAGERTRRPIVEAAVSEALGAKVVEQAPEQAPAAKSPAEMMHELLANLPNLRPEQRQAAANDLIQKLRQMGPAGLQAVRDFLRSGQEVKFQGGSTTIINGKLTMAPSLRVAFVAALGDWPGADTTGLMRDALRSTTQIAEASMAIRQLEAKAPGAYRAEAIQALLRAASSPDQRAGAMDGGTTIFDALRYYKAPELLAAAEKLVASNGWAAAQFAQALGDLPANLREPAMQRLFSNPEITKQLSANFFGLHGLNYSDPVISQNVAQMFAANLDRKARENFLVSFGNSNQAYARMSMFDPATGQNQATVQPVDAAAQKARMQSKLAFLDQIAPQCTTAVLQERLQDAREAIRKAIEKPLAPRVAWGINTVGGTSVIQVAGDSASVAGGAAVIQVNPAPEK